MCLEILHFSNLSLGELDPLTTQDIVRKYSKEVQSFIQINQSVLDFHKLKIEISDEIKRVEYRIKKSDRILDYYKKLEREGDPRRLKDCLPTELQNKLSGISEEEDSYNERRREESEEEKSHPRRKYNGWGDWGRSQYPYIDDSWEEEDTLCFSCPLLGEFYSKPFKIVLYRKAIEKYSDRACYDIDHILNGVLAHEFFHAYHYLDCVSHQINWHYSANNARIVKESLAAAFEFSVLERMGEGKACMDMIEWWELIDVNAYPYSGALGMLPFNTYKINKNNVIYDVYIDGFFTWELAAEDIVGLYRVAHMG